MADSLANQDIKHSKGAEMPDVSKSAQTLSRIRSSLPAISGTLRSPAVLVPAAISAAAFTGFLFYRKRHHTEI